MKHFIWILANIYGCLSGWAWLRPVHRLAVVFSLHGLGYDNTRFTGEEWFIKKVLVKAKVATCIDVGANVGNYAALLAKYTGTSVYALEPSSVTFKQLRKTAVAEPLIHPLCVAASDHNGRAELFSEAATAETATLDRGLLRGGEFAQSSSG